MFWGYLRLIFASRGSAPHPAGASVPNPRSASCVLECTLYRVVGPAYRTRAETVVRSLTARDPLGWQVHGAGSCYLRALEPKATRTRLFLL